VKTITTKGGVRYKLVSTGDNRWGPGKVHVQYWSKEHKEWVLLCRPNADAGIGFSRYYVQEVEDGDTPVTCKTCAKKDPR